MQTILGAGGAIGKELAKALTAYTEKIRLVSRNPVRVNQNDILLPGDITHRHDVLHAVQGSEVVYMTVGLEYSTKVWQRDWVPMMKNVIHACREHNTKLVFFDNVYSIGGDNVRHITEESPLSPTSKKGEVRAEVNRLLFDAMKNGVPCIIARAADFYGPDIEKSMMMQLVWKNLRAGKKAQWMFDATKVHSFTYTPDAAKAMALLGNTDSAFHQVWNLPTDPTRLTGADWIRAFAHVMHGSASYTTLPKWFFRLVGVFVPVMGELVEMGYQFDRDYFFDSSKFTNEFGVHATPYHDAITESIKLLG